ncbi:MAG: metalloregulator ArsR/SmtB family transcription factor [Rhodobacter sp.]|nr:metalloregulator ArsR/SmtB family transcription factor [Rhodobacter sp.]
MSPEPQAAFRALADPTRRGILQLLTKSDLTIAQISAAFPMTRAAVRKHLAILEDGQLIRVIPRGRERVSRLNNKGLQPVLDFMSELDAAWDARLNTLKSAIEKDMP